jgi:hypothetical protein
MTAPEAQNFTVIAENNVGQDGNAVLDAEHRQASLDYASGPVQKAIDKEAAACEVELDRRIAEKWQVYNKMLS